MMRLTRLALPFILFLASLPSLASSTPNEEAVHIQLRWHHQFQFAGYYAALERGYYRDEGLEVVLHNGDPQHQPVAEVLSGRMQYAEGNSEVLHQRLQGKPLVALAAIFQHSPSVLLVRKDSGINTLHDLVGRKVMLMDGNNDADFITMFLNEGIPLSSVNILPSSYNFEDLINRKVDAFNSYLTNEPFYLKQRNIAYNVIDPSNYRVDFYSDIFFTSENELRNHPERVEAMRRATLKGWRYAMDNPNEIIDLLINKYKVKKSRKHLEFEAEEMRKLILPQIIEIGHMNTARWEHMAQTFVQAGFIQPGYNLDGFVYDTTTPPIPVWVTPVLFTALLVLVIITLFTFFLLRLNRRLTNTETKLRSTNDALSNKLNEISELNTIIQEQSIRDPLTGVYNRRYLDEMLEREIARGKREGYQICMVMLDLDHFKNINDTYGHQAGDAVLKALGNLLLNEAREGDITCRYGGEEFLLVLPRLSLANAYKRAEEWRKAFGELKVQHGDLQLGCTMSIGLSAYPDHGITGHELINKADEALYKAKQNGRNRIEVAD